MEDREDTPIYYVNDFEDDRSDTHSINTTTSRFTDNTMSTLTSNEASGKPFSFLSTFKTNTYLYFCTQSTFKRSMAGGYP